MWLPPAYRKPHSARYWTAWTAIYALGAVACVAVGVIFDRVYVIALAVIPLQTAVWSLIARRAHHDSGAANSRSDATH